MKYLVSLIVITWLAGCSVLPESTPKQLYRLPSPELSVTTRGIQDVLEVRAPSADRLLASDHIVVWPDAQQVSVYADARWHDNASSMLKRQWQDALQTTQIALPAEPGEQGIDARLVSELNDFHIAYHNGIPTAVMRAQFTLLDAKSDQRLASQQLSATQAAEGEDVPAAVAALGMASNQLTRQLMQWLDSQLNNQ
ncbi:MAG: ABC-type transport auxiliary lipoprotein family protein [Pseudomonadota bacterium]